MNKKTITEIREQKARMLVRGDYSQGDYEALKACRSRAERLEVAAALLAERRQEFGELAGIGVTHLRRALAWAY